MAEETSIAQKASGWPAQFKEYVEELRLEMRRVTWPAWTQVRATTGVVIAAVFAFSAYFFLVDTLVGKGVTVLFNKFAK